MRKRPKPEFPSYTVTGVVTLDLNVGPDGRVIDVAATQCSLHNVSATKKRMKEACDEMETNGLRAVRKWKFDFKGAGHEPSYPMTATLPLYYHWEKLDRFGDAGEWRKESRTAYRRPAWRPADADGPRVGTSDVSDGALVQGDPALRLKDGFIGKVL